MGKSPEKLPTPTDPSRGDDPLAHELARRLSSIIGRDQRAQVVAQVMSAVYEERFSGPIAHPAHLREYEAICPGAAERIIAMAERNLDHAQRMQEKTVDGELADIKAGRWFGFAALMVLIVGAIACGLMGQKEIALALLGTGALGTIGAFIRGRGKADS